MSKHLYIIIIALLTGSMFTSCKKEAIEHENSFEKSYKTWLDFKKSSKNTYLYSTSFVSWTGTRGQTTITVKEGKVIQRTFIMSQRNEVTGKQDIREEWTEDETNLNTHPYSADPTLTLDEIYEKAKTSWLLKRKSATTYLETNNNGMISSCGFVEDNCADDCFSGIKIDYIKPI